MEQTYTTAARKGSVRHMAPERYEENPVVTPAVDVFSFGILLWQMVTGEIPFGQYKNELHVSFFFLFFSFSLGLTKKK